jgi:hypothetical protein
MNRRKMDIRLKRAGWQAGLSAAVFVVASVVRVSEGLLAASNAPRRSSGRGFSTTAEELRAHLQTRFPDASIQLHDVVDTRLGWGRRISIDNAAVAPGGRWRIDSGHAG